MLVKHASQHVLHMKKALMQVNLQLHHVITDITGSTGVRVLDTILAGNHDPHELTSYEILVVRTMSIPLC